MALAKETGTALCEIEDTPFIFGRNGVEVDPDKVSWALDTVWSLVDKAFKYSNDKYPHIPSDYNLRDFFADQAQKLGLCDTDSTLVMDMAAMWG